jgi:hypothetical protein
VHVSNQAGDGTLSLSSPALTMPMTSTQCGHVAANKVADDVHQVNHQSTSSSRSADHQHHDSHSSSSSSSSSSDSDEKNNSKHNKSNSDRNKKRKKNHQQIVREHTAILDNTSDSSVSVDTVNKSKFTNSVKGSQEKVVVKSENIMTTSAMNGHAKPHAKSRKSTIGVVNGVHSNGQAVHLNPDKADNYSTDSPPVSKSSNSKRPLSSQVIIENSKNKTKLEESMSTKELVCVIQTTEISYRIPAKGFLEENVIEDITNGNEDGKKGIGTQLDMIEEKYLEGILEDESTESSDDESRAKRHNAVTAVSAALHTDTDKVKVKVKDVDIDEYQLIHEPMNMESSEVHYYLSGLYFAETFPPAPANDENVICIKSANGEGCFMLREPSITENIETFALLPGRYFVESLIENNLDNDNPELDKQLTVASGEGCKILPPVTESVETVYFLPELCFMEVSRTKPTKANDEIIRKNGNNQR